MTFIERLDEADDLLNDIAGDLCRAGFYPDAATAACEAHAKIRIAMKALRAACYGEADTE